MAEYRDPTAAPGTTPQRTATTTPPVQSGGMSKWIWIIGAAVVAVVLLMFLFGGSDDMATAPADGDAVVTEPVAPADPAAPAPAPAD